MVEKLARDETLSDTALRELATLQAALAAVREELEAHGAGVGWSRDRELD
jgi:hypothetical protein